MDHAPLSMGSGSASPRCFAGSSAAQTRDQYRHSARTRPMGIVRGQQDPDTSQPGLARQAREAFEHQQRQQGGAETWPIISHQDARFEQALMRPGPRCRGARRRQAFLQQLAQLQAAWMRSSRRARSTSRTRAWSTEMAQHPHAPRSLWRLIGTP